MVIDSFSAILLAFDNINEARIALHVVLGKMLRFEGITNMLITEVPIGSRNIGSGMEEFVADGIIQLEHGNTDANPATLKVVKMRATSINRETSCLTLIGEKAWCVSKTTCSNDLSQHQLIESKREFRVRSRESEGGFFKGTTNIGWSIWTG